MKVKKDKTAEKESVEKLEKKSKSIKKAKNPVVAVIEEAVDVEKPVDEIEVIPAKTKKPKKPKTEIDEDNAAENATDTIKKKLSIKERKLAKKQKLKEKRENAKLSQTQTGGHLPMPGKAEKHKKKHKKSFIENRPGENKPVDVDTEVDPTIKVELPEELVTKDVIEKAISTCKKAITLEQEKKKSLFTDDLKIGLHIAYMKIPKCPSRVARVELKNPVYKKGDEICLIVADLDKGMKLDYEPTLNHWNELLNKLEIDFISKVISFNQLKKDYKPFEMKAKLAKQFDRFLVDGRISGNVFHYLGSQFSKRNKHPVSVKLDKEENYKLNLKKALTKIQYKQVNSGPSVEIPFGICKMDEQELVENVLDVVEKLKEILPGGWLNIKKMMIKPMTPCKIIFPIYVSKINPNAVPVPVITGPREKFEKKQNARLSSVSKKKLKMIKGKMVKPKREAAVAVAVAP